MASENPIVGLTLGAKAISPRSDMRKAVSFGRTTPRRPHSVEGVTPWKGPLRHRVDVFTIFSLAVRIRTPFAEMRSDRRFTSRKSRQDSHRSLTVLSLSSHRTRHRVIENRTVFDEKFLEMAEEMNFPRRFRIFHLISTGKRRKRKRNGEKEQDNGEKERETEKRNGTKEKRNGTTEERRKRHLINLFAERVVSKRDVFTFPDEKHRDRLKAC